MTSCCYCYFFCLIFKYTFVFCKVCFIGGFTIFCTGYSLGNFLCNVGTCNCFCIGRFTSCAGPCCCTGTVIICPLISHLIIVIQSINRYIICFYTKCSICKGSCVSCCPCICTGWCCCNCISCSYCFSYFISTVFILTNHGCRTVFTISFNIIPDITYYSISMTYCRQSFWFCLSFKQSTLECSSIGDNPIFCTGCICCCTCNGTGFCYSITTVTYRCCVTYRIAFPFVSHGIFMT